ncbi:hypothetical protein [Mycobacterium kubicae]|uniref:hypothetical protein n=1 Tax=Mycobacterium kubicae TaxID=120959 RepID=UPI0007FFE647|nr:hypothetical protein [Mycobacterium kubicae]OBK45244.1 hypothetical protein A5657_03490 [Mycobacterium kubicae]
MSDTNTPADVTLAETREAKTAARRRHPAGKKAAPATATTTAKKAAAKTTAKATKEATATTPEMATTERSAASKPAKLRWQFPDGYAERETTGQQAYSAGHSYAILPVEGQDGKYSAVVKADDGEPQYLVEVGAHSKCYQACVAHHRGLTAQPA